MAPRSQTPVRDMKAAIAELRDFVAARQDRVSVAALQHLLGTLLASAERETAVARAVGEAVAQTASFLSGGGWAEIVLQDVIEDVDPGPAVDDMAILHKPGSQDSIHWRVTSVSPEGSRVEIEREGSAKLLERDADGRWVYPKDVWATFEPAKFRMPSMGDSAVLRNEKTGRTEDGWVVEYISSRGAKVSITWKNTIKHLDRLPDGRWHHVGDVYATFEPAHAKA